MFSTIRQETLASASATNQAPPLPAYETDIHSLQAPAGIEQPYLERMVPVHSSSNTDNSVAAEAATRSAYGMGWSIVQGPPSLFAGMFRPGVVTRRKGY
ncbi:hypothetical protein QFC22_002824 [Naganishia vaughanmartiniae]|uniref:Uncharacterized protein n=1 Tax=Naganishia vaughanmartiniae TaxID=1424756 RepID=A0ACC2XBX0_9TREE|nr:hypothetical protein QFC22_002824 [Naganishia vaughanmartiniae]